MGITRYNFALKEIREAAKQLPNACGLEIAYQTKQGHQDIVSNYDKNVESYLTQRIHELFPQDGIIGEELPHDSQGAWVWFIDPIDGTSNFVNQHKNYAISIGCFCHEEPVFGLVLDVAGDRLFHAYKNRGAYCNDTPLPHRPSHTDVSELFLYTPMIDQTLLQEHSHRAGLLHLARDVRATRSLGSVALELCALAIGDAEIFVTANSYPWDHNAANIILSETGGAVRTWNNESIPAYQRCSVLATSSEALMERLIESYFKEA